MKLSATLARDEIALVLESLTPMRVSLDAERGRAIYFERPSVELVRDRGIRLQGAARVEWEVAGLAIPVAVQDWQVLVQVRVSPRRVIAFDPILEVLDLRHCPGVVENKLASVIDGSLAKARDRLLWDFGRTLSRRFWLPARVEPSRALDLVVVGGAVTVTSADLHLSIELTPRVPTTVVRSKDTLQAVVDRGG
jgi:hypothetical protein